MYKKREWDLGKPIKIGTGFAAGATIVEDPEENFVNLMVEQFPETLDFLEPLSVNPEDEKSLQYLDAFRNNLMLEGTAAAILAPLLLKLVRLLAKN